MAANLSNRVLYRSPDALQNLRLKVTLTRVSGPRMDRAREMDERFGAGPTPQAQIQAQQQQAQAATSLAPPGPPLASQPPAPSTPPPAPAPPQSQSFGGDELAGEADDASLAPSAAVPTMMPAPGGGSRRNRSALQQSSTALPGQGIQQAPTAAATFDPYGAGGGRPVTESYSPPSTTSSRDSPPARGMEAWTDDDASPVAGPVVEDYPGGAESLRDQASGFQAQRVDTGEVQTFTREIAWQEKIFSFVECDRIARTGGAVETELDRKYASMMREQGTQGETIYTYVSADSFADERDAERTVKRYTCPSRSTVLRKSVAPAHCTWPSLS